MQDPGTPAPSVTVVIPCYRQAEFLPEAVESVVAQTRTDWEAIIVDDGSPDATADVARRLIEQHGPRVRLLRQANQGVSRARNAAIEVARGRYILPLDADDRLHPEFLEETAGLLDRDPSIGVVYTDYETFDGESRTIRVPAFDADGLCRGNHIHNVSLYRREAWVAAGGYNPNMFAGFEDWDLWIGCHEHGFRPERVSRTLFYYRVRPGSRNDMTPATRAEMTAQVMRNHPALYTRRRRWVRRVKRLPVNLWRAWLRLVARVSRGRVPLPPEPW
jgi:glycosyltransferase involved in cell wall biosynthesis